MNYLNTPVVLPTGVEHVHNLIPLYVTIPIIVVLMILSAFFAMCDMAFSSVNVLRLKKRAEEGHKTAQLAYKLATKYDHTISYSVIILQILVFHLLWSLLQNIFL